VKRRRQFDGPPQTANTQELEEGEADAEGSTDLDSDVRMSSKRRASETPAAASPITPAAPLKRRKGRQPGQKLQYGTRLTEEDDIILANMCIARSAKYGIETMQHFWDKIRKKFEKAIGRKYVGVSRRMEDLIVKRKTDIKASHKSGHAARDDDWTKAIDGWTPTFVAHQKAKDQKSFSRKRKIKDDAKHEKRRDRLSQRMADKPEYPSTSSSSESSGNRGSSDDSSLDTIRTDAEDDAEASEGSELVTGANPSLDDGFAMRGALDDDEIGPDPFSTDEDYPPIFLPPTLPTDRSASPEPIGPQRGKAAKQYRRPTASAKSADDKKTPKRSKQARVSVADNTGLGVLQQALTDYFKGQVQTTRDPLGQQPLLKKIEGMLQKNLNEMQKLHQIEMIKTRTNIENALIEHYVDRVRPYFKKIFEGLDHWTRKIDALTDQSSTMTYWLQRAVHKYLPDDEREYHARPKKRSAGSESSRESAVASNAEAQ